MHIEAYRKWALIGYLVCPTEFLRPGPVDIAMVSNSEVVAFCNACTQVTSLDIMLACICIEDFKSTLNGSTLHLDVDIQIWKTFRSIC